MLVLYGINPFSIFQSSIVRRWREKLTPTLMRWRGSAANGVTDSLTSSRLLLAVRIYLKLFMASATCFASSSVSTGDIGMLSSRACICSEIGRLQLFQSR